MQFPSRILALFAALLAAMTLSAHASGEKSSPKLRFQATSAADANAWQRDARALLLRLLKIDDLEATRHAKPLPFEVKELRSETGDKYLWKEIELASTPTRRIKAVLTLPKDVAKAPAMVCIHGHGGNRHIVYDRTNIYHGFATEFAERGIVTI